MQLQRVLNRVYSEKRPRIEDLEFLLSLKTPDKRDALFDFADRVRETHMGRGILLRGIVEFSNHCRNTCRYCGLNRFQDGLERFRMTRDEVLACVRNIDEAGIKTVVLQSGEDPECDSGWLAELVFDIKEHFSGAVTLSVGEWTAEEYDLWRRAGADRYLLKIETTNPKLYRDLHPGMDHNFRLACLETLASLDYQTGSGSIVGIKGQSVRDLAKDILYFSESEFSMLGIGPFIPHSGTDMGREPPGGMDLALKMLAVARIVTKNTHLPATTALGSQSGSSAWKAALKAGANVIMPNFTPAPYRRGYDIYPGRDRVAESPKSCVAVVESMARSIRRTVDFCRGDSLKMNKRVFQADAGPFYFRKKSQGGDTIV